MMNSSTLRMSVALLALSLIPGTFQARPVKRKAPIARKKQVQKLKPQVSPVKENTWYKKGQGLGTTILEMFDKKNPSFQDLSGLNNSALVDKELIKLGEVFRTAKPESDEYKKSFADFKVYYQGLKDVLVTYTPEEETTQTAKAKNAALTLNIDLADIVLNAPDHATVVKAIGAKFSAMGQQVAQSLPQAKLVIDFKPDSNDPAFKKGFALTKESCAWAIKEAQGTKVSIKEKAALNKRASDFMITLSSNIPQDSPLTPAKSVLQFLAGTKKALEEFPLEEVLEKYKTPQDKAGQLRLEYTFQLQTISAGIEAMTSNLGAGTKKIGDTFQKYGTELANLTEKK